MTIDQALELVESRTGVNRYRALCDPSDPAYRPDYPAYVIAKATALAATPAPPAPPVSPSIPLAGDLVAAMTRRLGADRFSQWLEAKLGRPCGCAERQARLNALDRTVRRFLSYRATAKSMNR